MCVPSTSRNVSIAYGAIASVNKIYFSNMICGQPTCVWWLQQHFTTVLVCVPSTLRYILPHWREDDSQEIPSKDTICWQLVSQRDLNCRDQWAWIDSSYFLRVTQYFTPCTICILGNSLFLVLFDLAFQFVPQKMKETLIAHANVRCGATSIFLTSATDYDKECPSHTLVSLNGRNNCLID